MNVYVELALIPEKIHAGVIEDMEFPGVSKKYISRTIHKIFETNSSFHEK